LSYVNANLVLSHELRVPFHDWMDYLPFYKKKFLTLEKENFDTGASSEMSRRLFQVSFSRFSISSPHGFVKVLRDPRIQDLRNLIQKAVDGEVIFDQYFAERTLMDVFEIKERLERHRNMLFYLT